LKSKIIEQIGEGIDRLVTLDVRARGVIYNLYDAARKLSQNPLTLTAAQKILENSGNGRTALITTGFIVLPRKVQETDGPLGASALARALSLAFNITPILIIEKQSRKILASVIQALGIKAELNEEKFKGKNEGKARKMLILDFPLELGKAREEAKRILDEYKPSFVVAVEKVGRNAKGEYHTMRGANVSRFHAKIEPLIEEAQKRGILIIGVGDGGNEVGMGNIKEHVKKFVPNAKTCRCPCKGGIAAECKVDVLVTAAVSNWGAYGIEACIAALTDKPEVLHSPKDEELMLQSAQKAGAVDGVTGLPTLTVDGVPEKVHLSIIRMLEAFIGK